MGRPRSVECSSGHAFAGKAYLSDGKFRYQRCGECDLARVARKYGLNAAEYLKRSNGVCKICGGYGKLVADHDHGTDTLRDFICGTCNSVLGMAKDNPDLLRKAADYLERYRNVHSAATVEPYASGVQERPE